MGNSTNTVGEQKLWKAFLFSGLVMLGGAVAWGLCYSMNFFSGWVAVIVSFLAVFVYHKFYKKVDWKMWVWTLVLSCLLNLISLFVTLAITLSTTYDASFGASISALFLMIAENSDFSTAVVTDVISTLLFTVIGVVVAIGIQNRKFKNEAAVDAARLAAVASQNDGEELKVESPDYDAIIAKLQEYVQMYIDTGDKDLLNKNIEEFKNVYIQNLTSAQINALKAKAKAVRAGDNSSVPARALACDIIENKM